MNIDELKGVRNCPKRQTNKNKKKGLQTYLCIQCWRSQCIMYDIIIITEVIGDRDP